MSETESLAHALHSPNDVVCPHWIPQPIWWRSIEGKLKLSRYVEWSFISCQEGVRKPDDEIYKIVSQRLGADPESLILVDDSKANVDAAKAMGWNGVLFLDAAKLDRDLALLGVGLEERESEPT